MAAIIGALSPSALKIPPLPRAEGAVSRRAVIGGLAAMSAAPALARPLEYHIPAQIVGDGVWILRGADAAIGQDNGGAIANITLIDTPAGAVLIDCGPSVRYAAALKATVKTLTGKPVVRVYLTHLHPDHLYASAAFDPAIVAATPALIAALAVEGRSFIDGMYRLLGDWMRGTEFQAPGAVITMPAENFGGRVLQLLPLAGHSSADLAVFDARSGLLIAGDLVFHDRAPATPHADLSAWRASLDRLRAIDHKGVIPGHGPFDPTPSAAIDQTRDWLDWAEAAITQAVINGIDPAATGAMAIPPRFAAMKVARYEFQRTVSHLYPRIEAQLLPRVDAI
jgi:quinoprotein relay system zinc metallohydrolase 1